MAPDGPASAAASRPLPPIGRYVRDLAALGLRSMRPALPALVFLCFYRFGMDLYLELAGGGTTPLGYPDDRARVIHAFMTLSAYLPLLVLVYTPFLPLQDALMRGERRSFTEAMRAVLERFVPFVLSALLQGAILLVPIVALIVGAALVIAPFPDPPQQVTLLIAVMLAVPILLWILLAAFLMVFAVPAVVLDGHGAWGGIRHSVRLVRDRFGGLLGRFVVFGLLFIAVVAIASSPGAILRALGEVAGWNSPALPILGVLWGSAVTALSFPFWVASLMILYRALVPRDFEPTAADAAATGPGEPRIETPRPETAEQPTPYIFE